MALHVVLLEPEIPQNTGNIARTCVATGATLHLIGPMGFSIDEKQVKRAGLDYWELLDLNYYDRYADFLEKNKHPKVYCATTKAQKNHSEVAYPQDDTYIMFGKETAGIPKEILKDHEETCIRIPMVDIERARSLNLSNAVSIVVYEVLRQWGYSNMR
ncbi:tRNA (uridine(34)/cytosine(34)/5-carboxymethylaminomethyluridine(34)-2'-O)-methyltransferase TrmL [Alkaliphilus metalliredigens]|uniref:tRNA (uridine(34)/cytosine(34)/5- carboxymethylaminomethyluridine(34)-2'-O)- methyltransferase TrmL n=1 Tax=Alkaliphilus metalliredigens TaxID=208226 RepID=UPI0002F2710C|nr:tRNA (uridine(34)/cytosine(34)/5-carboxymethylaminomethyluridine(34)-2'-O)-methyltransferase TrmL [Alkaliphilus metalliredigens]